MGRENAKLRLDLGAATIIAVVPALSSDAQLRIGGPITTGRSFAKGLRYRVFIERSRGMGPGIRRDDAWVESCLTIPATDRAAILDWPAPKIPVCGNITSIPVLDEG